MSKDFIPRKNAQLLLWAQANSALITATPTVYSLTAAIATAYAAKVAAYSAALTVANGENRGRVDVINLVTAKRELIASIRSWARTVQGSATTTTAQRAQLGLNLRDKPGSPIHPPTDPPVLEVVRAVGRQLDLKIRAAGTDRRSKAAGAVGATILSYVGNAAPADASLYTLEGQVTRERFTINFPPTVAAGARVWICAMWYTARAETSPLCVPISAYVAGGVTSEAVGPARLGEGDVSADTTPLRQAA